MFFYKCFYQFLLSIFCIGISFLCATQSWAVDIRSISPSSRTPSSSVQRNTSFVNTITLKADLRLVPYSVISNKKSTTAGQQVEITALVQNLDAVIRNRVRVRFSCKTQKKDVFINLRPRQRQQVRAKLTIMGPAGSNTILVEVNPLHRELAERDYRNNTGTTKISVAEKKTIQLSSSTSGLQLKKPNGSRPKLSHAENFPVITGVHPDHLLAGKEYTLKLQGIDLSGDMKLDFGKGVRVIGKLLPFDKFVMVPLVVDAKASPGKRKITLHFNKKSKAQRPTITLQAGIKPVSSAIVIPPPVKPDQVTIKNPVPQPPPKITIKIPPKQKPVTPKLVAEKPDIIGSLTLKSDLSSMRPNRWLSGRKYQVTMLGSRLDGIDAVSFGSGIKVDDLKHHGETRITFFLEVEKRTTPGARFATIQENKTEQKTGLRGWIIRKPIKLSRPPTPVWSFEPNINLQQAAIFLQEPGWKYSGDISTKHPVPVLNDESVFTWKEETPGLADRFEVQFFTALGRLVHVYSINLGNPAFYITSFKPDSKFIAELMNKYVSSSALSSTPLKVNNNSKIQMQGRADSPGKLQYASGEPGLGFNLLPPVFHLEEPSPGNSGIKRMTPVQEYIRDNKNEVNLLWQVVGYKSVTRPQTKTPSQVKKLSGTKKVVQSQITEMVEIEVSERWPLRMSKTWPTGVTCDADNQFELSVDYRHPEGWDPEDPNHYPGDDIIVSGKFSITNSPWAIAAKTTYATDGNVIKDQSYQFNNIIVDWGDGIHWQPLEAKADLSPESGNSELPGWSTADYMSFKATHQYEQPGTFQVRIYVVPQDQMDKLDSIVAAHGYRPPGSTAESGLEKLILLASSGQIVSDAGGPEYSVKKSPFQTGPKWEMPGSRIFMLYCNPLDVTIVQDTAATGALHLKILEITSFSSDDALAGLGQAGMGQIGNPGSKTASSAVVNGAPKGAVDSNFSASATGLNLTLQQAGTGLPKMVAIDNKTTPSFVRDATVSPCEGGLWAKARLKYYGQGYARIKWLVDDVVVSSREIKVGPSELRQNLSSKNPDWGEPLLSEYCLESPRLPIKELGLHRLSVSAVVIADPTWSAVNAVALQTALLSHDTPGFGSKKRKKQSSAGSQPALPPVAGSGGLQPAFVPLVGAGGIIKKDWSKSSHSMSMTLQKQNLKNVGQVKRGIFMPPYSVISPEKRYLVQENPGGTPCRFLFPTLEGEFEVAGLKNLQIDAPNYSGNGLFIYKLPDGPHSSSEHYVRVPFSQWLVPDGLTVAQGVLETATNKNIDNLPGMSATLTKLQGTAGEHLRAVMDVAIKDVTIRLAGSEVPPVWPGVSSVLTPDGDWYAADLSMGRSRIGWSMTNIESDDVRLDLSHTEGESPGCGSGGPDWVGVHLGNATLYPYMFDLDDIPVPVKGWSITDSGLCGRAETGSFSHVFGEGAIGWNNLTINAAKGSLNAQYAGFYVDMAWPKVRLEGSNTHFSYSPGSDVEVQLGLDNLPVIEERYDVIDMKVIPKTFGHHSKGWGLQTDAQLSFRDEQGELFAGGDADPVIVNDLFFTIYSNVEYGGSTIPLNIEGQVGGADELITALELNTGDADSLAKMTFDFTSELSIEGLGRAEQPVHIIYGINKASHREAYSMGPDHPAEIILKSQFPETNPVSVNEFRIKYKRGSDHVADNSFNIPQYATNFGYSPSLNDAGFGSLQLATTGSISGGTCGNDSFGGAVDTEMFGSSSVIIKGTFRFGKDNGSKYWLAFFKGANLHIPVYASVFLEMVQGGLAYNFDHDAFNQDNGFGACPAPGKGVLFSAGLGLSVGGRDVLEVDGVLTIQPADSFYEMLVHANLYNAVDLKGRLRYWQSAFDGEIWGDISLLNNLIYIDAPEHSCGVHLDSGTWFFHAGTKDNPVTGHLTSAVDGKVYMMLGNHEGFKVGAQASKYFHKTAGGFGVKGDLSLDGAVGLDLNPLRFDGKLGGHLSGKFINPVKDIGISAGAHTWIGCCNPEKFGFGVTASCTCAKGGVDVYLLPNPKVSGWAEWTCDLW